MAITSNSNSLLLAFLLIAINIHTLSSFTTLTTDSIVVAEICRTEVVSFSACLSYTASPPNNFSSSASDDCCSNYNGILVSGRGFCLCYLLHQPPILGAPLDSSKILSLSVLCPLPPPWSNFNSFANFSLLSVCSDASPPLQSSGSESGHHPNFSEQSPDSPNPPSPSHFPNSVSPTHSASSDSPNSVSPSHSPPSHSPTPLSPSPTTDLTLTSVGSLLQPPPEFYLGSSQVSSATRTSFRGFPFERFTIFGFSVQRTHNTTSRSLCVFGLCLYSIIEF